MVFGGAQASADEVTAPATPSTESTTAASAETTTTSEGAPAVLTASEATPASLTASEASSSTEATSLDKGALQLALSQAKALDLSNKTSETVAFSLGWLVTSLPVGVAGVTLTGVVAGCAASVLATAGLLDSAGLSANCA